MFDHISNELVYEILKGLSLKSLGRLRCVNKSFYSLISCSSFFSVHLAHSIQYNKAYQIIEKSQSSKEFALYNDDGAFSKYKDLKLPFETRPFWYGKFKIKQFKVIGSCYGLICIYDWLNEVLFLWNPSIEKYVNIFVKEIRIVGFGFDSMRNDFKVVILVYDEDTNKSFKLIRPLVYIFDVSSKSWRFISVHNPTYVVYENSNSVYLNGVVHWLAHIPCGMNCFCTDDRNHKRTIATFCLSNEQFGEVEFLHNSVKSYVDCVSLFLYGESLAFLKSEESTHSIWVMKEYGNAQSWSKQIIIDLNGGIERVLCIWSNGEIFVELFSKKIASYDTRTNKITSYYGLTGNPTGYSYVESLALL